MTCLRVLFSQILEAGKTKAEVYFPEIQDMWVILPYTFIKLLVKVEQAVCSSYRKLINVPDIDDLRRFIFIAYFI